MKDLPELAAIELPEPRPDQEYGASALGERVSFRGLKRLLGAADYSKAGDRHAGLAASSENRELAIITFLAGVLLYGVSAWRFREPAKECERIICRGIALHEVLAPFAMRPKG